MATFVAIAYDDPHQAHEVRLALARLQKEYLIDLADAVVAVKDTNGKVKLHQTFNLTAAGALSGGFWGTLIGLLFFSPLLGAAIGASAGALKLIAQAKRYANPDDSSYVRTKQGRRP